MKSLDKNLSDELQKIANEHKALVMSFIAPDKLVRKSPAQYDYATIAISDLYSIEKVVEELAEQEAFPKKLMLVIHTPGGLLYAATKIAKYIRTSFSEVDVYVPYEAASGGTMICLIANQIILDKIANLTPIDPQLPYKGVRISSTTYDEAIRDFTDRYGKLSPEEIPSPYQQMANTFDPILAKEMDKLTMDTILLAWKFLNKAQNPKNEKAKRSQLLDTAFELAKGGRPHSHIIDFEEANEMGLPISKDDAKIKLLKPFKKWVSSNLYEDDAKHIIQYFCPEAEKSGKKDEDAKSKK